MPTSNGPTKLSLASGISGDFLRYHRLCPVAESPDGTLIVAMAEGAVESGVDDLATAYGRPVVVTRVDAAELEQLIARLTTDSGRAIELTGPATGEQDDLTADVRDLANQPPVVRYVNLLVRDAYDSRASDIHPSGGVARSDE